MKKCVVLLLAIAAFAVSDIDCDAECVVNQTMDARMQTIPVYVITKGESGPLLSGGKITVPLGQYVIGKDGKLINVTGLTLQEIFKAGLVSYGIVSDCTYERVSRCVAEDLITILYVFDYYK